MNYDIVIATKDRYDDLKSFLGSLLRQSVLPDRLIIVDASVQKNIDAQQFHNILKENSIELIYIKTLPGLTRQRNLGVKNISDTAEIVFFLTTIFFFVILHILKKFS